MIFQSTNDLLYGGSRGERTVRGLPQLSGCYGDDVTTTMIP